MKCKECKYKQVQPEKHPCNNCKHCPIGEYDYFEPAEPVVLSAEQIFEKLGMHGRMATKGNACDYGRDMHDNGRLERDLELMGLVEAVREVKYCIGDLPEKGTFNRTFNSLYKELENLKPLNKE